MKTLKIFLHLLFFVFLTILTQIGGLIWVLTPIISYRFKFKKRYVFISLYVVFNLLIIPPIANYFGRVRLPSFNENVHPRNIIYPLLFRNYVRPELKALLIDSSEKLKNYGITITYLDANFPFYNGFPLLPHLSHNDGKKIDLSFQYLTKEGKPTSSKPSISGYGVFVNPNGNYTSKQCKKGGYWQYDYPKYLTFGTFNTLEFDKSRTKKLIKVLSNNPQTQKIFIEPYLKINMGLENYDNIRFHGCGSVRHDDHIHLQIK